MPINPMAAALLASGGGLAGAAGPSRVPVGFGQAFSQAAQQGLGGYLQAQQMGQQERLADLQALETILSMRARGQEEEQRQKRAQAVANWAATLKPEQRALAEIDPDTAIKHMAESQFGAADPAKAPTIETFYEGGQAVQRQWDPTLNGGQGDWREVGRGSRWEPGGGADGSKPTALMQEVPYLARVLGISEADAARLRMQAASGRATPEQVKTDLAKSILNNRFGISSEQAVAEAEQMYDRLYSVGGPPAPMVEAPPATAQEFSWYNPMTWGGGGSEEAPATAVAGQVPQQSGQPQAASPHGSINIATGQYTRPAQLPMAGGKIDPSQLKAGVPYTLPNGEVGVWDGQGNFVGQ